MSISPLWWFISILCLYDSSFLIYIKMLLALSTLYVLHIYLNIHLCTLIMLLPFHISDVQWAYSRNTIYQKCFHTLERERHLNNVSNNSPPISSNIVHSAVNFESLQISISTISVIRCQCTLAQATAPADIPQSLDISLPQSNPTDWWVALSRSIPRLRTMTNEWREVDCMFCGARLLRAEKP